MKLEQMKLLTDAQLNGLVTEALMSRNLYGDLTDIYPVGSWVDFHVFTGIYGQSPAYVFNAGISGSSGAMFQAPCEGFVISVYDSYDHNVRPMSLPRGLQATYRRLATLINCRIVHDPGLPEGLCLDRIDTSIVRPSLAVVLAVIGFARLGDWDLVKGVEPRCIRKLKAVPV